MKSKIDRFCGSIYKVQMVLLTLLLSISSNVRADDFYFANPKVQGRAILENSDLDEVCKVLTESSAAVVSKDNVDFSGWGLYAQFTECGLDIGFSGEKNAVKVTFPRRFQFKNGFKRSVIRQITCVVPGIDNENKN